MRDMHVFDIPAGWLVRTFRALTAFRADADYGADRPLVNYIWINKTKAVSSPDGPMCSIGLQYINRALENANRYPQADFRIWIDRKLIDDPTNFWIGSFIYDKARHKNVRICDLRDIPDYAGDPVFLPDTGTDMRWGAGNVYSRADYARILVLDHCLKTDADRGRIFYSDIDCKDICLPHAVRILDKHSIVINDMNSSTVSHGYIGIDPQNEMIKAHFEMLKKDTKRDAEAEHLGFYAFTRFLNRIGRPHIECAGEIGMLHVLPHVGAKIRPLPLMRRLGIN